MSAPRRINAWRKGAVTGPAPTWVIVVTWALAIVGLGIAVYVTILHFDTSIKPVCTATGPINCEAVLTSQWSSILGIPVSVLGLFQYVVMSLLCSPWAWRTTRRDVHLARLVFAVVGMCFVVWLIAAEALLIHNICLWCTGVHVVTFVIFVIVVSQVPKMLGWTER